MNLKNKTNDYVTALGPAFDLMPKAVIAAVAVSLAARIDEADAAYIVLNEWRQLHANGLVPQPVPGSVLALLEPWLNSESR
jgi:hypothetical protein